MSKDFSGFLADSQVYTLPSTDQRKHVFWTVAVSIFDANGAPVAAPASSTMALSIKVLGSDQFVASSNTLDLAANQRSFDPFFEAVEEFRLTPTGLSSGQQYTVTITKSSLFAQ